jgi:hypothetical protein
MTAHDTGGRVGGVPPGLRPRQLTEEEFGELIAAAARAGLARGAYAAEAALSVARGMACPADSPLREALGEFIRTAWLVRRIGVNLNQAVAKLNATERNGWTPRRSRSAGSSGDRQDQRSARGTGRWADLLPVRPWAPRGTYRSAPGRRLTPSGRAGTVAAP